MRGHEYCSKCQRHHRREGDGLKFETDEEFMRHSDLERVSDNPADGYRAAPNWLRNDR